MAEYLVTVKYEGVKVFRIEADDFQHAYDIARHGPEHQTNEESDTVDENILSIQKVEIQ